MRDRYVLGPEITLPTFFLDCHYDEDDEEEKTAYDASFENILSSAKMNEGYNAQRANAAKPLHAKLEEEKKVLEEEKESLLKKAKDSEAKARNEAHRRELERLESINREQK